MAANNAILAALPQDATRVQVVDEFGKTKFKAPHLVSDKDHIVLNGVGEPVVMTKNPGRRKKPVFEPANEKIAEMLELKDEHVKSDDLLGTIRENPETSAVLDYVMTGLAEEAASLGFERLEAERNGMPTSQISVRRISALKAVGDSWLRRKEQVSAVGVELDSPGFKRLFTFIMDTFKEALGASGVRAEVVETVFTNLSKRLDDDWQKEATKKIVGG